MAVKDTSLASLDAKLLLSRTEAAMGLARKVELEGNAFNIDDFLIRSDLPASYLILV